MPPSLKKGVLKTSFINNCFVLIGFLEKKNLWFRGLGVQGLGLGLRVWGLGSTGV